VFQVEGQIFSGRRGKVKNPRLAGAIFDSAVESLILEAKTAVLHR
jgi:hypothetical protein